MRLAIRKALLILSFVVILTSVYAQRPRIGLSLSGGGAKGLAHTGILKAIDKAGLKIDYITGTSMGAIIGAMYAAGYSGEEIEVIAGQLDWAKILRGAPSYYDVRIYEKDEYENYSVSFPLNKGKLVLNTGLIESEEIWLQFSEIFSPVRDIKDFNDFDIPFKCIATDLTTGDAVVLDKGDIVFALRASMALPGVFPTVPYKDTELVDGGIIRNFPVVDLKDMGADYVIGVNLFSGLSDAKDLNSVLDVMYQITNYRDAADLVGEKAMCDMLIEPTLDDYSAGSFADIDTIMAIGNKAGKQYYHRFKQLADSLNALEAVSYSPEGRLPERKALIIDRIEVSGLEYTTKERLLSRLKIEEGSSYKANELSELFRNAYASLNYQYLYYDIEPTSPGHCVFKCIVKENPASHLNVGLSYHSFTNAAVTLGYGWRNLATNRSYSLIKLNFSENWRTRLLHRQMFGAKLKHGLEFIGNTDRLNIPVYDYGKKLYLFEGIFNNLSLDYYYLVNDYRKISLGVNYYYASFKPTISTATFKGHLSRTSLRLAYHHNSLDRKYLPRKGCKTEVAVNSTFNRSYRYKSESGITLDDTSYTVSQPLLELRLKHSYYKSLSPKFTLFEQLQAGYIENSESIVFDNFMIGGIQELFHMQMSFAGLQDAQQNTSSLMTFGLGGQYNVFGELYTILRVNAGIFDFDNPFKQGNIDESRFLSGAALSVAYYLSALPLEFSFMYSPEIDRLYTHISVGFTF